jgi:hypothetical protein
MLTGAVNARIGGFSWRRQTIQYGLGDLMHSLHNELVMFGGVLTLQRWSHLVLQAGGTVMSRIDVMPIFHSSMSSQSVNGIPCH